MQNQIHKVEEFIKTKLSNLNQAHANITDAIHYNMRQSIDDNDLIVEVIETSKNKQIIKL